MNFHILESNGTVSVCFHIDVPPGLNDAGCEWSDCVMDSVEFQNVTCLICCDHEQDLKDGKIIEMRESFKYSTPGLSDSQKKIELQERHEVLRVQILDNVYSRLRLFGFKSD